MRLPIFALAVGFALSTAACGGRNIHDAAAFGELERVQTIVEQHPGMVNAPNKNEKTPIYFAITTGKRDVFEYLIDKGAKVEWSDMTGYAPLHIAAIMGREDMAKRLMEEGADIEVRDKFGDTPLHVAAYKGRGDFIEFLADQGANINAKNEDGRTPLDLAIEHYKEDAADTLRRLGGETTT